MPKKMKATIQKSLREQAERQTQPRTRVARAAESELTLADLLAGTAEEVAKALGQLDDQQLRRAAVVERAGADRPEVQEAIAAARRTVAEASSAPPKTGGQTQGSKAVEPAQKQE